MKNRVIYGAVLIAVMLVCVFASEISRTLFFAAAGILCMQEYAVRFAEKGTSASSPVLYLYMLLTALLAMLHAPLWSQTAALVGMIFLAMLVGILNPNVGGGGAVCTVAGLSYPGVLFAAIFLIGVSPLWLKTLSLACLSTWVCDSAAMFGGNRFGKHKFAPAVSPNKTMEGSLCGAVSSVFVGLIVWLLGLAVPALSGVPLWLCIVTCVAASTMGQIGDLAESLLKRMLGVKDFSSLIPGHGGMFDRADSLLFSIPTAWLCLTLAGL